MRITKTKYNLTICILLLVGCATIEKQEMMNSLEKTLRGYENAIRWGYYQVAQSYRKVREKEQPPDYKKLKEFKVSTYEVIKKDMSEDKMRLQQTVEIKYYHINFLIEKTLINELLWVFDVEEKKWYLHSKLPDFK